MIKRRFYKLEHDDKENNISYSSSSSSDEDESDAEVTEEYDNVAVTPPANHDDDSLFRSTSSGFGYESDDSSTNEVDADSTDDNEAHTENNIPNLTDSPLRGSVPADVVGCILKCKSVFKCRLCPQIVCLSEKTLKAHLKSKKHSRYEKLLKDGRLKLTLNSDGKIDEDGETHEERHA